MDLIPAEAFRLVESRRRRRAHAQAEARQLLEEAAGQVMGSPVLDSVGSRGTPKHDKVDRVAIRLMDAEARLETAERWEEVFRETDEHFGAGSDVVKCAGMLYDKGLRMTEAAAVMFCDRQTVRRLRDGYVIYCAFVAQGKGLINADD